LRVFFNSRRVEFRFLRRKKTTKARLKDKKKCLKFHGKPSFSKEAVGKKNSEGCREISGTLACGSWLTAVRRKFAEEKRISMRYAFKKRLSSG
jgi:hypothetical protein